MLSIRRVASFTHPDSLGELLQGEPSYRVDQLRDWVYRTPVLDAVDMTNPPSDGARRSGPACGRSMLWVDYQVGLITATSKGAALPFRSSFRCSRSSVSRPTFWAS